MKHTLPYSADKLFDYIKNGTSAYHVVSYTKKELLNADFTELDIKENWNLKKGGKYFVSPFDTVLFAFTIGSEDPFAEDIHIAGAHADSPAIKIKPCPDLQRHGYMQLNTEVYGGPILSSWFDRPLSISGKIVCSKNEQGPLESILIDLKEPVVCLPNLAIHMKREINDTGVPIDRQKTLLPISALNHEQDSAYDTYCNNPSDIKSRDMSFLKLLTSRIDSFNDHLKPEDIIDYDLCIYNCDEPKVTGFNNDFIISPRLDDISSVCAVIDGLIKSENKNRVNLACLFDNEEIGSRSKQGAASTLTSTIIKRIWGAFGRSPEVCMSEITQGLMLSVDVAHAYHPNFPEVYDITNYPVLGGGVCIKTAANQSYASDPEITAYLIDLCRNNNIPYQRTVKNSNNAGGTTIGSIISAQIPMRTADVGIGLLAMHSSCETAGTKDIDSLTKLMCLFFS